MANNIEREIDGLPVVPEKELAAINRLLSSDKYRIKERDGFLHHAKKDLVSSNFVMSTLNDFVEHIYALMAAIKRMLPSKDDSFLDTLQQKNSTAAGIITTVLSIDIKTISNTLADLQAAPRNVSVAAMQPFIKTFYKQLICIYYLEAEYTSSCLMETYRFIMDHYIPANPEGLREDTMKAVQELNYIYSKIFPSMYPLVLRMTSNVMLSERDLFYKNGSKVLAWLEVMPDEIFFPAQEKPEPPTAVENVKQEQDVQEEPPQIPENVYNGLEMLEHLFPEAGWEKIPAFPDQKTDFAPYFASIFRFSDTFIRLNPNHPLHIAMILFQILSELFQGLRHVNFDVAATEHDIHQILDDWFMYMETIFNKTFGDNFNTYTHYIYNRPEFAKTPYADKLITSMYSTIRQYFLPFFDMRFYPFQREHLEKLPPLFSSVKSLHAMLETSIRNRIEEESSFAKAENAYTLYRFDVPNAVSTRLDAFYSCIGKIRTNRALIKCCVSILSVLDWWLNDKGSPAYKANPKLIYRTAEGDDITPVFEITERNDISSIFSKSLKSLSLCKDTNKPYV